MKLLTRNSGCPDNLLTEIRIFSKLVRQRIYSASIIVVHLLPIVHFKYFGITPLIIRAMKIRSLVRRHVRLLNSLKTVVMVAKTALLLYRLVIQRITSQ